MADATNRPPVQTPKPQRDDLQRLIPDNVRLRRALEQLFTDVNQVLPDAVQQVGDNSQAVTEDVSMGVFGATDRAAARTLTWLADTLGRTDQDRATIKKLSARLGSLEAEIENSKTPIKPRVEKFIAPTFSGTWANFGSGYNPAGYYKDPFGIVRLRGLIAAGTINTVAFVLPAGYRPGSTELISTISLDAAARLEIAANGNVVPVTGTNTWFSLDNVTFRAV